MWYQENPWPIAGCGIGIALLSVLFWSSSRRRVGLVGVVLGVLIGATGFALDEWSVTPREKLTNDVRQLCLAFKARDLDRTLSYISKRAPEVEQKARLGIEVVEVGADLTVRDVDVELLSGGTRARTRFSANATVSLRPRQSFGRQPSLWEVTWEREGEDFRIIKVVRLDPVGGKRELGLIE